MIRQLHDSLWVMDFPLRMPGGVQLGARHAKEWMARCNGAAFYAPPTFEQKLPDLPFETLTDTAPADERRCGPRLRRPPEP